MEPTAGQIDRISIIVKSSTTINDLILKKYSKNYVDSCLLCANAGDNEIEFMMKHAFQPTCPYFTFHSDQMQKKRYDQVSNLLDYKSNT